MNTGVDQIHVQVKQMKKEKIGLSQSCDKSPNAQRKIQKATAQYINASKITSITERLQTDIGRSVGETTATKLVWINRLRIPIATYTFPLTAKAVQSKGPTFKKL